MKRSTAVEFVGREVGSPGMTPSERAERIVAVLENNQPWDPEEPELPRRLRVTVLPTGLPVLEWDGYGCGYETRVRFYEAAANAYNRLQSGELVPLPVATEEMLKLIRERDDLKKTVATLSRRLNAQTDHIRRIASAVDNAPGEEV